MSRIFRGDSCNDCDNVDLFVFGDKPTFFLPWQLLRSGELDRKLMSLCLLQVLCRFGELWRLRKVVSSPCPSLEARFGERLDDLLRNGADILPWYDDIFRDWGVVCSGTFELYKDFICFCGLSCHECSDCESCRSWVACVDRDFIGSL